MLPPADPKEVIKQLQSSSKRRLFLKNFFLFLIVIVTVIVILRVFTSLIFSQNKQISSFPQPVAVTTTKQTDVPVVLTELGTVIPITNVTIQSRVSGYLQEVYFTEGKEVKKDDLLALIDPRPYEALKAQYEGTLASDIALLKQAQLDNNRYQTLLKQKSIAVMTAQDQQYKVAQLEGQVKTDKALIHQQELNILYSHIRAPTDGRIGIRQVDPGNYITEGQSGGLAVLTKMDPISVIFTIPENKISTVLEELQSGISLTVDAWNSDNTKKLASGKVSVVDSQLDTSTGTIRLRAIFDNKDWKLFPNQFVNAHLLVKTLNNVIILPNNALQTGPNGQFVYVLQADDTVKVQNIKAGYNDGENTVIQSGLKSGEKVVTDGIDQLRDGAKVSVPGESKPQNLKE